MTSKPLPAAVYFAARYSRRDELRGYRDKLHIMGGCVTSRWLDGDRLTDTADRGASDLRQRVLDRPHAGRHLCRVH